MGKVLVVEDNKDIQELYKRLLHKHELCCALTSNEAFEALARHEFELIILDCHLAENSGIDVLRHIRTGLGNHKVTVFMISSDDGLKFQAKDIGIQLWMTKPIDVIDLYERVEHFFEKLKDT